MTPDALHTQLQRALGTAYVLDRELGGAGMSRVFVATEASLGRSVVVKVLPPELSGSVSIERFKREIQLAARLQHPHIVPLLTAGDAGGLPYFTMPYVEGESLRARLAARGEMPIAEAMRVLREIASALAYAHERGIVHRDIKPDNVMLSDGSAMVTDFGVAKALSSSTNSELHFATSHGVALGTPAYMSPEQASADPSLDHRTDIYAFGVLAYELLSGQTPFAGRTPRAVIAAQVTEVPETLQRRRATVPTSLAAVVMKCLEKRPADRPQSAAEVVHVLDEISTPSTGSVPFDAGGGAVGGSVRPNVRARRPLAWVAAIVLLVVAGGVFAWRRSAQVAPVEAGFPRSIAVLPFDNIGRDTNDAYFADGMAEELRIGLAKVSGLTVSSRSAATGIRERGGREPGAEARRMHVGALLEGTVRRDHDRLRLTAQLTRTDDGSVLWTESYEQSAGSVFAVQDSVAHAIVSALRVQMATPGSSAPAGTLVQGTRNLQAYDAYLQGRYLLARRENLPRAIEFFKQSIARDSLFARAYAGLAMAYSVLSLYTKTPTLDVIPPGIAAGRRAIALDSTLSDAELALANVFELDYRWSEAETHFKRAFVLDNASAAAYMWYGDLLYVTGRLGEAEVQIRRAMNADPTSAVIANDLAYVLVKANKDSEAAEMARRAMALDSSYLFARANYISALVALGKVDSARAQWRYLVARQADQNYYQNLLLMPRLRPGSPMEEPEKVLAALRRDVPSTEPHAAGLFMLAHGAAGHADSAAMWLGRAIDRHSALLFSASIPCQANLDPVHDDPRFQAQLRRLGVGECQRDVGRRK